MPKRPTKQALHSWWIFHLKGTPAQFIGIVQGQPDAESAIEKAMEEFKVPENLRGRLVAQQRD